MEGEYTERFLRSIESGAATAPEKHQSILRKAYEAVIRGDFDTYGAALADDIELIISGFGPLNGSWKGRAAVVEATRKNFAQMEGQQPEVDALIHQGDSIAVLLRESGRLKSTGKAYHLRGVQWLTFEDGKIKKIDEILASASEI